MLQQKQAEVTKQLVLFYDDPTNYVGMLINVITSKQEALVKYVTETY